MQTKVSLITPVYNASSFIDNCIESILNQTYINWELILVDDGSQDDSLKKCRFYSAKDSRIKVFSKTNGGPSSARNIGIDNANGKYITFIDSDDYLHPTALEKLTFPFLNNDSLGLSCGGYFELSPLSPNKPIELHDFNNFEVDLINQDLFYQNIFNGVTGVLWGKMFLLKVINEKNIRLNHEVKLAEDMLFVFEYVSNIDCIFLVKEPLYYYNRLNENGLTTKYTVSNLKDIEITTSLLKKLDKNRSVNNLDEKLKARYIILLIKIIKAIAIASVSKKEKWADFDYLKNSVKKIYSNNIILSKQEQINLFLYNNKFYYLLLLFNRLLVIKNKIQAKF
jgi:glycosyltransferase involved in cell wall biosynthesis